MDTTLILITRSDGGLSAMTFIGDPTPEAVDAAIQKGNLDSVSWRIGTQDELPGRDFRDAWTDVDGSVGHDLGKARDIHRARLRKSRAPLLGALDVDAIRATEVGDAQALARIATRKQVLRDLPADPRIEAATTVEDLAAVTLPPGAVK